MMMSTLPQSNPLAPLLAKIIHYLALPDRQAEIA